VTEATQVRFGKEYQRGKYQHCTMPVNAANNSLLQIRLFGYRRASGECPREERHSTRSNNAYLKEASL